MEVLEGTSSSCKNYMFNEYDYIHRGEGVTERDYYYYTNGAQAVLDEVEQLKKENADLKSAQNKIAIEKLEDVKYIIFDTPLDKKFYNYNPEKKSGAIFEEINTKLDTMLAELKGEK